MSARVARHDNYIGGTWQASAEYLPDINPSRPSEVIGEYAQASREQAQAAVQAARSAFPSWSHSTPQQRFDVLDAVGGELLARKLELGELLAREEGKTLAEGIAEVVRAGQIFKYFAGEAVRDAGDLLRSVRPGIAIEVSREPIGVVALITPWNFPMAIPAWKIAPALAFGNCVLFKPAGAVPGCAWALTEILARSGLPAGALNLVNGPGAVAGNVLVNSPEVDAVSFTGSVATGAAILAQAAARHARVQLEMGGKNPLVVLDDADLDVAIDCAVQGAFYSTGQRCTASSRLIVTGEIHDRFVAALTRRIRGLVVGDALDPHTQIGPVVDEPQLASNLQHVQRARAEGAEIAEGGTRCADPSGGYFMRPALLVGTLGSMAINREEVFGPVASVIRVKDYEEALVAANDTDFGLSAGICTRSLLHATHFKRNVQVGMVMVNLPTAGVDYHVPFGGRKRSSYGPREQGAYAREFYTSVKTAYTRAV